MLQIRVKRSMCATCIGRPAQQAIGLGDRVTAKAVGQDGTVTCHSTLDLPRGIVSDLGGGQAVCRWFFDHHKTQSILDAIAYGADGGIEWVPE